MRMRLLFTCAIVLGCFGLTACGQKGDLYLPAERDEAAFTGSFESPAPFTLY